jgi:radical SAM superfamily enzyme YgiQ (UPF0313 family)
MIRTRLSLSHLPGDPKRKTALLINPPVYDTQYWAEWAQPYGLLRIVSLLKAEGYKRIELFDFMATDARRRVSARRINPDESYDERDKPSTPRRRVVIQKGAERLELNKYHFGRAWREFDDWLDGHGFTADHPPDEVWISAVMTYWWESVRDLTARVKRRFGTRTRVLLGGIYPTLAPEHAAAMTGADIVVAGEVPEANELWADLSLYERPPPYAIITPGRGCPYNCAYCAQKILNACSPKVMFRCPEDIVAEMRDKYERHGIREFAFYADFLLWDWKRNFGKVLELLIKEGLPFHLHAPEGLDTRFLSKDPALLHLMKEAHFEKIYLPLESIHATHLEALNRRHVQVEHFARAARMCEEAGFRLRNLEVNAFVLYGLPNEKIDDVVKTVLFASEMVGSIIPMLFAPVPSSGLYQQYLYYFEARGWDRDLHMLNGKLYPFLEMNEGTLRDYIDIQRLMYMLNTHYRSRSFQVYGDSAVAQAFRTNLTNGFHEFVEEHTAPLLQRESQQKPDAAIRH